MIAIQHDENGIIQATVYIPEPVVSAPLLQTLVPDGTVTEGMRLDMEQEPPVLIPYIVEDLSEPVVESDL